MNIRRPPRRCHAKRWLDPKTSRATRARCESVRVSRWRGKPGSPNAEGFAAIFWDHSACIKLDDGTLALAMRSTMEAIAVLRERGREDLANLMIRLVEEENRRTEPPRLVRVNVVKAKLVSRRLRIRTPVRERPVTTYVRITGANKAEPVRYYTVIVTPKE
jgi:hypothetical protein